jgi:hypothetical protein
MCTVAGNEKENIFIWAGMQNMVLSMHSTKFHITWLKVPYLLSGLNLTFSAVLYHILVTYDCTNSHGRENAICWWIRTKSIGD